MRVVVFGYHDVGCAGLEVLLECEHEIAAVYTHADDPQEARWFGSLADRAAARGIPVERPEDPSGPRWIEALRATRPDVLFSFYYRRLLDPALLAIPPRGAFNLHGSLLPRYRGRCPLNWVLIHGERETGVTLHHMVERADAGDIVGQRRVPIGPDETAPMLHRKLVAAARDLLRDALPAIEHGDCPRRPQDARAASYFGRRRPEDGHIDWNRPAREIHDLVRAVTRPWPGAFTILGGERLFVWSAAAEPSTGMDAAPGVRLAGPGLRVGTGAGALRILCCQLEGRPELGGAELAAAVPCGVRFGEATAR